MTVLGTKLHVPTARRRLVPRPRLTARLRATDALPRLVLVSAPAGFGKTTVLGQWLAPEGERRGVDRVAWLSLDEGDNDLGRFLTHLVAALRRAGLEGAADVAAQVETARDLPVDAVLTRLVNDVEGLPGETVLALDDYHVIEHAAVHEAVEFLLENLPPGARLAIATRADPPLPLARLRARAEMVELRASDLRFTATEADTFLNEVMGLDLRAAQVSALDERTEGWVAGLQLAALSMRDRDDVAAFVDAFTGSHRFVLDYLVEEVLRRQPDRVSRFLLDTALLDQLAGPLCDAVTGGNDGQAVLESLERDNLFVVPLDEQRVWYRYHHLFADALRARLAGEQPTRLPALHRAASRWYSDHGRLEDAIGHALAGDDPARAADLMERALPDARRGRRHRTIRGWLDALPDDLVRTRPLLAVPVAWVRLLEGDLDGVESRLRDAEQALRSTPAGAVDDPVVRDELRNLPAWIEIYRAAVCQARGDEAGTAGHARRALGRAGPGDHLARGGAAGFLGLSQWAAGDLGSAVTTFTEAVEALRRAGNVTDVLGSTVVLAEMWLARGRPRQARQLCDRALAAAGKQPGTAAPVLGDLHVAVAGVLREQGEVDAADEHLQAAKELGEGASLPENRYRWFEAMAGVRRARGDLDGAGELLDLAEELYVPGFFPDVRPIPAQRARLRITQGRLQDAWDWAREHLVVGPDADLSYRTEYSQLTLVRLVLAQARADGEAAPVRESLSRLARLADAARTTGRGASEVEIGLLQALAHQALGEADEALVALAQAQAQGVPAGYVRLFLDEGAPMVDLLAEVGREPGAGEHARRLLDAVGTPSERPETGGPAPREPLSDREVEVLGLLATDLTGPEIARQLFVSLNTFRTHTRHIFTKLDVNTRQAAVRRATDLGLL